MQLENKVSVKDFIKYVSNEVLIPQYNGFSTESFSAFNIQNIILKIHVSTDDCFSFCKQDVETILRAFIKSLEILPLWNTLSKHIYWITTNENGFNFNVFNVIFGEIPLNEGNKVVNFIMMSTKQYIFNCLNQ